jgi:putative transposase
LVLNVNLTKGAFLVKKSKKSVRNNQAESGVLPQEVPVQELSFMALVQWGASRILEVAVRDEIEEHLGRARYKHAAQGQEFKGYRNGTRKTKVDTAAGPVEYQRQLLAYAPDYRSKWHTPHMRRPEEFAQTVADMYVGGVSTRKVKTALKASAGEKIQLERSTVSRITKRIRDEFDTWKKRDLSELKVVYLFLDAIRVGMRLEASAKESILIAHAILEDGQVETLAIGLGNRESKIAWGDFLGDLRRRGLADPTMVISDGNLGVIAAIDTHFEKSWRQRCVKHKCQNVLDKVPKEVQEHVGKDLSRIFYMATGLEQAKLAVADFRGKYFKKYPSAVECLEADLEQCLSFYMFPTNHWKRLRTSNCLERMNLEIRRRLNVIGRHPSEKGCLSLIHQICKGYSKHKKAFKVNDLIKKLWQRLRDQKESMIEQLSLELQAA